MTGANLFGQLVLWQCECGRENAVTISQLRSVTGEVTIQCSNNFYGKCSNSVRAADLQNAIDGPPRHTQAAARELPESDR